MTRITSIVPITMSILCLLGCQNEEHKVAYTVEEQKKYGNPRILLRDDFFRFLVDDKSLEFTYLTNTTKDRYSCVRVIDDSDLSQKFYIVGNKLLLINIADDRKPTLSELHSKFEEMEIGKRRCSLQEETRQ